MIVELDQPPTCAGSQAAHWLANCPVQWVPGACYGFNIARRASRAANRAPTGENGQGRLQRIASRSSVEFSPVAPVAIGWVPLLGLSPGRPLSATPGHLSSCLPPARIGKSLPANRSLHGQKAGGQHAPALYRAGRADHPIDQAQEMTVMRDYLICADHFNHHHSRLPPPNRGFSSTHLHARLPPTGMRE